MCRSISWIVIDDSVRLFLAAVHSSTDRSTQYVDRNSIYADELCPPSPLGTSPRTRGPGTQVSKYAVLNDSNFSEEEEEEEEGLGLPGVVDSPLSSYPADDLDAIVCDPGATRGSHLLSRDNFFSGNHGSSTNWIQATSSNTGRWVWSTRSMGPDCPFKALLFTVMPLPYVLIQTLRIWSLWKGGQIRGGRSRLATAIPRDGLLLHGQSQYSRRRSSSFFPVTSTW